MSNVNYEALLSAAQPVTAVDTELKSKYWVNIGISLGDQFIKLTGVPVEHPRKGETALEKAVREQFAQRCAKLVEGSQEVEKQGSISLQFVHTGAKQLPAEKVSALQEALSFLSK